MDQRTCRCGARFIPTHGRQTCCTKACRQPTHARVTLTCDCCGGPAVKYRQAPRYEGTYCSTLCRDYARHGATACTLPREHWARWYGATSRWSPPVIRNEGECAWCGGVNARHQSAAYCSPLCKRRARHARRRALESDAPGEYRYADVVKQYIRQGRVCAYCEQPCDGLPDPEHVVPLSRGGRNDMSNLVAACKPCNSDKRDLTLPQWASERRRRGKRPVRTSLRGPAFAHLRA